jgi:outer membrane lipoprotein LolB
VIRLRAAALLCGALLAACASPPRQPGELPWTTGRMSLRIDATPTQPMQSVSAAFELRGDGTSGELRLNSPLGSRVASARWAPGLAVLANGDGERSFGNLDELSRVALGENLPLAALPDWLAGKPWTGAPHDNTEAGFEQLGWQVSLARRGEGWIEARRSSPPAVLMRVRLDDAGS